MTDIKLSDEQQIINAANGETLLTTDIEELIQSIKLEAMTQEGELFYDLSYGWSLYDFIQRDNDELFSVELNDRAKNKLKKYEEIDQDTINITTEVDEEESDIMHFQISFKRITENTTYSVDVSLSRISVEVINSD